MAKPGRLPLAFGLLVIEPHSSMVFEFLPADAGRLADPPTEPCRGAGQSHDGSVNRGVGGSCHGAQDFDGAPETVAWLLIMKHLLATAAWKAVWPTLAHDGWGIGPRIGTVAVAAGGFPGQATGPAYRPPLCVLQVWTLQTLGAGMPECGEGGGGTLTSCPHSKPSSFGEAEASV